MKKKYICPMAVVCPMVTTAILTTSELERGTEENGVAGAKDDFSMFEDIEE